MRQKTSQTCETLRADICAGNKDTHSTVSSTSHFQPLLGDTSSEQSQPSNPIQDMQTLSPGQDLNYLVTVAKKRTKLALHVGVNNPKSS